MFTGEEQALIRLNMFEWLSEQSLKKTLFTRQELRSGFTWRGQVIPLMDPQKGIWNPKAFDETVSITSMYDNPYGDMAHETEEVLDYRYQNSPTGEGTNTKLRLAYARKTPLILFEELTPGNYLPRYPVFVTEDFREDETFRVSLAGIAADISEDFYFKDEPIDKAYAERMTLQRIHQPRFRARVISAYQQKCAICSLQHVELLDAAHIVPDSKENGFALVSNGLALCKIHHASYDRNVIGISPDYKVVVPERVMNEVDGPMLEYGIKRMNNATLNVPKSPELWPSKDGLAFRFEEFLTSA